MNVTTTERQTTQTVGTRRACVLTDTEVWSSALRDAIESIGVHVTACNELNELFDSFRERPADLLVLAHRNAAFAVRACRVVRDMQDVPMMVVMQRDGDLIPVLDAGADDAVVSRVEPAVFAARVRALIRRTHPASQHASQMIIRDLVLDFEKYQVTMNGKPVPLTPTEFRLLAVLAQQAGRVVDPRALLSAVHQHDYSERDAQNLVKVHIANLRRKINDSRTENPYILCVRGFGYMLERRYSARQDDPLSSFIDEDDSA
jgi:two-component system, OmpR family, response regulator MtrA